MTTMTAYRGRHDLKAQMLAAITAHEQADEIVQGTSFDRRGEKLALCAVGCSLESLRQIEGLTSIEHSNHALYERYLGVPIQLARLEDSIFEGLPIEDAKTWPRRFADAIPVGADLSMVWPRFLRELLADPAGGVQIAATKHAKRFPKTLASLAPVIALFDEWIAGVKPASERWQEARREAHVAYAAAYAAASAAAYAAYAAAASADADADDAAAASADAYAADAAAAAAARWRERRRQADVLLRLLSDAPVLA